MITTQHYCHACAITPENPCDERKENTCQNMGKVVVIDTLSGLYLCNDGWSYDLHDAKIFNDFRLADIRAKEAAVKQIDILAKWRKSDFVKAIQ